MLLGPGNKARNLFGEVGRLLKVIYGVSTVNQNFLFKTVFLTYYHGVRLKHLDTQNRQLGN